MDSATQTDHSPETSVAQRILDEGAQPLLAAAREAGLRGGAALSLKTWLRKAISGELEAIKVGGRWLTSSRAIRRCLEAAQLRRQPSAPPAARADANAVLSKYGLGRDQEGK